MPAALAVAGWLGFEDDTRTGADTPDGGLDSGTLDDEAPDDTPGNGADDGTPGDDGDPDDSGEPEGDTPPGGGPVEPSLTPPDLEALDGVDAIFGTLLVDIDAAEQVMITFQSGISEAFGTPGADPEDLLAQIEGIARQQRTELLEVRDRLTTALDDPGADTVREHYVAHLDTWVDYMGAIEDDPRVLAREGSDAGYTVAINATADAFARSLADELPGELDTDVRRFAEGILDRGFRSAGHADV